MEPSVSPRCKSLDNHAISIRRVVDMMAEPRVAAIVSQQFRIFQRKSKRPDGLVAYLLSPENAIKYDLRSIDCSASTVEMKCACVGIYRKCHRAHVCSSSTKIPSCLEILHPSDSCITTAPRCACSSSLEVTKFPCPPSPRAARERAQAVIEFSVCAVQTGMLSCVALQAGWDCGRL